MGCDEAISLNLKKRLLRHLSLLSQESLLAMTARTVVLTPKFRDDKY